MGTPASPAELVVGLEGSSTNNPTLIIESEESPSPPFSYVQTALQNPVILESVFKNLDVSWIKIIRKVCRTWNRVATPSFRRHSQLAIVGGYPDRCKNLDLLKEIEIGGVVPERWNFSLRELGSSQLGQLIDKLSSRVKNLHLLVLGSVGGINGTFAQSLPFLQSLEVIHNGSSWDEERIKSTALTMSEMVSRAPNLRQLKMDVEFFDESRIFWEVFWGPEGLGGGNRLTLDKLSLKCCENMSAGSMENVRRLKLELKEFSLVGGWSPEENEAKDNAELFRFFQDQTSSLETLILRTKCFLYEAVFLSPMKRLKRLEIHNMESLKVNSIIPLLSQLPVLESFSVCGWRSVFSVVKRIEVVESEQELVYPNLKELKVDFGIYNPRLTFSIKIEKEYCPPYIYVPKLFPNLRKLSFHIFSNHQLLSCIDGLREMVIEELELKLIRILEDSDAEKWNGDDFPSLNNWKQLRKVKLEYERIMPITHLFETPLESILPEGLTSLEILVGNNSIFQKGVCCGRRRVGANFLINILQHLPLLMNFKLEGMSSFALVDTDGNGVTMASFVEQIREDPFIPPHLYVQTTSLPPQQS